MTKKTEMSKDNLPVIALVGRVNVGKSTLFNRLIEDQKALVSDIAGTTRTNNEGLVIWRGKYIRLVDTGGLSFENGVALEEDIIRQSEMAMKEADIVLFVTDAQTGVLPQEKELAKRLRRIATKPVILIANKVDNKKYLKNLYEKEWFSLGLGEPFAISGASGSNTGDLLDLVYTLLNKSKRRPKKNHKIDNTVINVSLIGKPNVGKSSLFNKIIGQEKVIVSDMAHTTREPHDTMVIYDHKVGTKNIKQKINFVDTAGIRRKAKVTGKLEREGIFKSIDSATKSEIILFVVDGTNPISSQDMQLGGLLQKHGKSVLILVNKWDLIKDNSEQNQRQVKKMVYSYFPHLNFAPMILASGKTGLHVHDIFPEIMHVWNSRQTKIPVKLLEHFLEQATREHRPSRGKGTRHPKLMGIRQVGTAPPVFEIFVKYRTSVHRSYVNYLENKLREKFDFHGTPIIIKLTKMKK